MTQLDPASTRARALDLIQGVHGTAYYSLVAIGRTGDFLRHVKRIASIP